MNARMCPLDLVCRHLTCHWRLLRLSHSRNQCFIPLFATIQFSMSAIPITRYYYIYTCGTPRDVSHGDVLSTWIPIVLFRKICIFKLSTVSKCQTWRANSTSASNSDDCHHQFPACCDVISIHFQGTWGTGGSSSLRWCGLRGRFMMWRKTEDLWVSCDTWLTWVMGRMSGDNIAAHGELTAAFLWGDVLWAVQTMEDMKDQGEVWGVLQQWLRRVMERMIIRGDLTPCRQLTATFLWGDVAVWTSSLSSWVVLGSSSSLRHWPQRLPCTCGKKESFPHILLNNQNSSILHTSMTNVSRGAIDM